MTKETIKAIYGYPGFYAKELQLTLVGTYVNYCSQTEHLSGLPVYVHIETVDKVEVKEYYILENGYPTFVGKHPDCYTSNS